MPKDTMDKKRFYVTDATDEQNPETSELGVPEWIDSIEEKLMYKDELSLLDQKIDGSIGGFDSRTENWIGSNPLRKVPIFEFRNLQNVNSGDNGFVKRVEIYEKAVIDLHAGMLITYTLDLFNEVNVITHLGQGE